MGKSTTVGRNVWDACQERDECRYGLAGVKMKHVPTGRVFECGGSLWNREGKLLVYTEPENFDSVPDEYKEVIGPFMLINAAGLMDIPDREKVPADECELLSQWPIVCCRPRRRRQPS